MDFSLLKGIIEPSNKILFISQFSKILENEDENRCLKTLNSIHKFDKKYAFQLSSDTRSFLETILFEKYKFIFDTTENLSNLILSSKFIIQKKHLFQEKYIIKVCDSLVNILNCNESTENQKFDIAETICNFKILKNISIKMRHT